MYLVQRGHIASTDIKPNSPDHRFSNLVELEYMGSSEFEWGAIPQSLRRMGEQIQTGKTVVMQDIRNADNQPLRVYYGSNELKESHRPQFIEDLHQLRAGTKRLKECSRFEASRKPYGDRETDFWWDLESDVMWSFNKYLMNDLPVVLKNSLDVMNKAKG